MSFPRSESPLDSGLLELSPGVIDELPETPAVFRLRSSGQRVMYVGHAGDEGLREAVRELCGAAPVAGISRLEYSLSDGAAAAEAAAEEEIRRYKPLYNEGFGRFRNAELSLPKRGHRIRRAMHNP
ncbi:MAG TPA: hypothetical protein QGG47_05765 [Acidobacteriota bacterium]|nr:hypothetical protein [Acidobacteriota bacterium]